MTRLVHFPKWLFLHSLIQLYLEHGYHLVVDLTPGWPNMTFAGVVQARWQVNWCCFIATLSSLDTIANKKGQTKEAELPSIDCSGVRGSVGSNQGVAWHKRYDDNKKNEIYYATSQQTHQKKHFRRCPHTPLVNLNNNLNNNRVKNSKDNKIEFRLIVINTI